MVEGVYCDARGAEEGEELGVAVGMVAEAVDEDDLGGGIGGRLERLVVEYKVERRG